MKYIRLLSVLLLTGCTALMSQTPIRESRSLPESPDAAYQRAVIAMARLGGEVTQANAQARLLSARVHNAVILNVVVEPESSGATIHATCTLMPNKLAVGSMTECTDYLALLGS